MDDVNPYASPQVSEPYQVPLPIPSGGVWREGKLLVMHKNAVLPDRCVKSNVPSTFRLKRNLSWHHPAVFLLLLCNLLIFVLVALIVSKRATIYVGLSDEWRGRRRSAILIGWCSFLFGATLFGFCLWQAENQQGAMFGLPNGREIAITGVLIAIVIGFVGSLYGLIRAQIVKVARMDGNYIWLKGVHPAFLAELPELSSSQTSAR